MRVPSADGSKLRLTLDTDGMLTLLGATKPWNSGQLTGPTVKSGPLVAEVSNDGGFVLVGSKDHQIYWRDGLNVDMRNGERLHPDKVICSPDGSTSSSPSPSMDSRCTRTAHACGAYSAGSHTETLMATSFGEWIGRTTLVEIKHGSARDRTNR